MSGRLRGFELDVQDVDVVQRLMRRAPFPISLKEHGVDFLMEHRHLWMRTPRQSAILRVRATIMRAARSTSTTNGFIRTDPPILTPNACEGTSELFEMDYFEDDMAYLTQSRAAVYRGDGAGAGQGVLASGRRFARRSRRRGGT